MVVCKEKESNEKIKKTNANDSKSVEEEVVDEAVIRGELDGKITVQASGFEPNSLVEIYMFSEPTFVGVLQADANGNLLGNLPTPDLDPGVHTLQA